MRDLQAGNQQVLIAKYNGKLYAVGSQCPHRQAPLSQGMLFQDKVVCPWHGASFNIQSGALEYNPSVDGIPTFEIVQRGSK
jgi:apoptosis-inducing factor 3